MNVMKTHTDETKRAVMKEGYDAYHEGFQEHDNPYMSRTQLFLWWDDAFHEAAWDANHA